MQCCSNRINSSLCYGVCTRIVLEQSQRRGTARIGEDLTHLGKKYGKKCMNLVFVACTFVLQLRMQTS